MLLIFNYIYWQKITFEKKYLIPDSKHTPMKVYLVKHLLYL